VTEAPPSSAGAVGQLDRLPIGHADLAM